MICLCCYVGVQAAEQEAVVAAERQKKADLELKLKEAQDQTRALELMMQQKTKDIEGRA